MTTPKRILVVSDGLPGHYKKTNAVAQIVQKRFSADVQWLKVRLRFGGYRTLMRFMLNHTRRVPNAKWLNMFYDIPDGLPAAPDMIISSGGKTSFMSAWLGAHFGCPSMFIGQVRGIEKRYFARIVASNYDYQEDGKHIRSVPATEIDPDVAEEAAEAYLKSTGQQPARRRRLRILGGRLAAVARHRLPTCRAARHPLADHDLAPDASRCRRPVPQPGNARLRRRHPHLQP
jgi:mitochondrial fission protein ELM1